MFFSAASFFQRVTSPLTRAAKASGVDGAGSQPSVANRALTSLCSSDWLTSVLMRSTTAFGVPAGGHRQRLHLAGPDLWQQGRQVADHHVHLVGQYRRHRGRGAFVGYVGHLHAGQILEQLGRQMRRAADAARGIVDLARLPLGIRDKLGDRLHSGGRPHQHHVGRTAT